MSAGYNGVTLFFMLSGFVLAWNYTDKLRRGEPRELWSFAIARIARIYPLYLTALLWVVAPSIVSHSLPGYTWKHVLAVQPWSPDLAIAYGLNGPGWSVGVEFFLYACFPILLVTVSRIRRTTALFAVCVAAIAAVFALAWWFHSSGRADLPWTDPASAHRWLYRMPLTRLGDFTIGIVAALLIKRGSARTPTTYGLFAQVASVVVFAALMTSERVLFTAWSWDAAYVVPAALLIWGLATAPHAPAARLLATRPLILAGEASFAFYLLHAPLLSQLAIGPTETWYGFAFTTILEFFVILFVAVGAHQLVEVPAQRWLRSRLDRTQDRRRPEPQIARKEVVTQAGRHH